MAVLGLLLMAGLGFAATAIMEHMDEHAAEEDAPDEAEDQATPDHGSMLDDPAGDEAGSGHAAEDDAACDNATAAADHDPAAQDTAAQDATADHAAHSESTVAAGSAQTSVTNRVFGTEGDDTLMGSTRSDLMEGNGGDDLLRGGRGQDHLVSFDAGHDTTFGGAGADSLHGFTVQREPGDLSFVIEDHQADHLHGGLGRDVLSLASDDVGTGGRGEDEFHVSWDIEPGHPAEITDYNPAQDKLYVQYASNHADADMSDIRPDETSVTTEPMQDGSGTAILLNGHAIAHVLGTTDLQAADIGLIPA